MKRFSLLAIAAFLTAILSGCIIEVDPVPTPSFTIIDPVFSTNQSIDLGVNGETGEANQPEFVICDDRQTELIYRFSYNGSLNSFRSYLRGEDTGAVPADGDRTFSTSSLGNPIEVRISIPAGLAPLSVEPTAIGVRGIIGYSTLHLDFPGTSQDKVSRRIAVIDRCS
jgi:hypothetical protein